jgi:hypothetical protein
MPSSSREVYEVDLGVSGRSSSLPGMSRMSMLEEDWGWATEDDTFHPMTDDPWWTETIWFAWMVPERNLLGYFYPVFRPNLGVEFGGVIVFDHTAELPWELPVFHYDWHLKMPADLDLRDARLPNGMSIKAIEAGRVYELGYTSDELKLDLRYEALFRPMLSRGTPPFTVAGHLDQPGHVTGSMVLHGEEIAVDCFAMRDRAWGPRRDGRQPKVGYAYATRSADSAFLAVSVHKRGGLDLVTTGFLMRDGDWVRLCKGTREVERDERGRPAVVTINAEDELGRQVQAVGRVVSRQVFTAYPSMFCWNSLVRWEYEGVECWGEDQDIWGPPRWKEYAATLTS